MTGRVIVGLLWLAMVVVAAGAWSAGALRAERQGRARAPIAAPAPAKAPANQDKPATKPVTDERLDLYGNKVEPAVGDYRIDGDGALYEQHAPQVEVARLAAPVL